MDSISSVSPSVVLPPSTINPFRTRRRQIFLPPGTFNNRLSCSFNSSRRFRHVYCRVSDGAQDRDGDGDDDDGSEEAERALHLDGTIPGSSNEFVKRVSSRAYDMRRHLQQTFDSSSYDGNFPFFLEIKHFSFCTSIHWPILKFKRP